MKNLSLILEEEVVCRLLVLCGFLLIEEVSEGGALRDVDTLHESRNSIHAATSTTDIR